MMELLPRGGEANCSPAEALFYDVEVLLVLIQGVKVLLVLIQGVTVSQAVKVSAGGACASRLRPPCISHGHGAHDGRPDDKRYGRGKHGDGGAKRKKHGDGGAKTRRCGRARSLQKSPAGRQRR